MEMKWRSLFLLTLLLLAAGAFSARAESMTDRVPEKTAQPLRIIRVTPEGEDVTAARQIVIEFNRPVVPVGRMDRTAEEVGVTISPALGCQWRWLNTSALACQLDDAQKMPPATRYQVTVSPVIAAEDGGRMTAAHEHHFITQRPAVRFVSFRSWDGPAHPVMRVVFNQPVSKRSVAAHLYLEAGQGAAAMRHAIRPAADQEKGEIPVYLPLPGENAALVTGGGQRAGDDQATEARGEEARRIWLVEPAAPLPPATAFSLIAEPGLLSALGPEPGPARAETAVAFSTFPDLSFAGVRCSDLEGNDILIAPGDRQGAAKKDDMTADMKAGDMKAGDTKPLCDPMRPVSLAFSTPVMRSQVKGLAAFFPPLGGRRDANPWGDENRDVSMRAAPYRGQLYHVTLPVGLKAAQEYRLTLPGADKRPVLQKLLRRNKGGAALEDQFGRMLPASITMVFATDHRNPNYVLPYNNAVLEKDVDSEVPLYVNNLSRVTTSYRAVNPAGAQADRSASQDIPAVRDVQFAVPLGVRDMVGGGSGALYGTLSTAPAIPRSSPARIFAQVTPYQVHMKLGHFESLAWVTDMATGQPVPDAGVRLYVDSFETLSAPENVLASARTDGDGLAVLPGVSSIDPRHAYLSAWRESDPRLFLRVDKGADMALLPLSYDFSASTWRASDDYIPSYSRRLHGHVRAWGMTAQGVYRAGDTIQYKIFVRDQDNRTLVPPPAGASYTLEIADPLGKTVETIRDLRLSAFGTYAGEFSLPKSAVIGWYDFTLRVSFPGAGKKARDGEQADQEAARTLQPLRVLVSDFTPSPFNVTAEVAGDGFSPGQAMDVAAAARLHSGGAYADAAIRATVTISSRAFTSDDPAAKGFFFDTGGGTHGRTEIYRKQAVLDDKGEWKDTLTLPEQTIAYGTLSFEAAVQDDRGKNIAAQARADYLGVDRLVGLKSPSWVYEAGRPASFPALVVDGAGKPVSGVAVRVTAEREVVNTVKVKGAGNAYLSDTSTSWERTAQCDLVSAAEAVSCEFTPATPGTYRIAAEVADTKGAAHSSTLEIWVAGRDYVQWDDRSEMMLPIVPEKASYHVGDTARYLIKNPYPGAQALVTVERYGVIDSFVRTLEGSTPVIEFPVKPDYMPGFYLSVVAVSPRVEKPLGAGQVDLGKPAFRMGYVTVPVSDPYKEMDVTVSVEQDVYRPRDTVTAALSARPRMTPDKAQPVELAVAVLDEAVFDLIAAGRDAFDPYKGFYSLEALDVGNYSLMTQLLGRQKFEKKGANPGGDGGGDLDMRNIFKYVSYWNPAVPVDADGKAVISFAAPDNLTGWRVLALAVTPGDRMGLGQGSFRVNRPTELRPVMPNQVREGDRFSAGFSVMNRTDRERTLAVAITASGDLKGGEDQVKEEAVTLGPYKRATIFMTVDSALLPAVREVPEGRIAFTVSAGDADDRDGMEFSLPVHKARTFDVAAAYAATTDAAAEQAVHIPAGIHADSGDVGVVLSPSVIGNVAGAFRYMRDYPYTCWEQRLTQAVMAAHYKNLKAYLPGDLAWPGHETLPAAILADAAGYQAPNGGMAYFTGRDEYADPYLSAYTALAFGWLKKDGYDVPAAVESRLHEYLQSFLRRDTAPDFYQPGMKATVRAVALAALAEAGKATPEDIRRYEPHVKSMSLFGKAQFLHAAVLARGDEAAARAAAGMILSSGVESGGKFMFNETYDDGYARILSTPVRDNCAILGAFLSYGARGGEAETLIGDKPFRLVRAITQSRGNRDHWENTQENIFCMKALSDYARRYETETPVMDVKASFGGQAIGQATFRDVRDAPVTLSRPLADSDAGRQSVLTLDRTGKGRLYYATRLRYALKDSGVSSVNAGMELRREYSVRRDGKWELLPPGGAVARGALVRVDLFLSVPSARNFVVVDDPVPGGLEPVNRDLATASALDAEDGDFDRAGGSFWFQYGDWRAYNYARWSFYHRELRHDAVRFYSDWLSPGNYHLSYTAQAVATGTFAAPPASASEMYDPDIYGRSVRATMAVTEQAP